MTDKSQSIAVQETIATLLKQYTPDEKFKIERDILSGRYRIMVNQPLPHLGSKFANAYDVNDNGTTGSLYALVFHNQSPIRKKHIDVLKEYRHPNMVSLIDSGIVEISSLSEARFVVILEKPVGQPIATLLSKDKQPVSQAVLVNYLLRPFTDILKHMYKAGISHNRINLENVYISNNHITLGECISEPSGYSQDYIFEPSERMIASPLGKADYNIGADCYALAILALHLTLGIRPFHDISKEDFIENMFTKGSFHTLIVQWDFSSEMQDLFRGLLNDARRERWDPESIGNWLMGRQFNLIMPSIPAESSRGFDFKGHVYYNRKAVANAISRDWKDAYAVLADNKLGRWVETSVHKPEAGDHILRASSGISSDNIHYERLNNESIARIISLLDPGGPIRLKHLATMIDSIGTMITSAFLSGEQDDLQTLVQMLESDLPWFVNEQLSGSGQDYGNALWKLQRTRNFLRNKAIGFGIERCIYDLHPELPCQSKLIKRYHVTTLPELLLALDTVASQKAAQADFMDRHIAGFIASRLDITKEIRVNELEPLRNLETHPGLIALKFLVKAQNKIAPSSFCGLTYWIVLQLLPVADLIHRRSGRDELKNRMLNAASTGSVRQIAAMLFSAEVFISDYNSFQGMVADYALRKTNINELRNHTSLMRHSRIVGRGIAQTVSYGICLGVIYYTLRFYFHF